MTLAAGVRWRLDSGLLLRVLLFVAILSLAAVPPVDPDLWWHLANGRLLVQLGSWPHTDLYSFSAAGHPWVMHEWLSDLLMYALYMAGGLPLLVAVFAGLVMSTAVCLFLVLRWTGLHPTAAVLVTMAGALAGSTAWGARPQVINVLLIGLLACGLLQYREGRLKPWWLIPFLWLWANLHSGFLTGVILTALFLLGEGLAAWGTTEAFARRRWRELALALGLASLVAAVNPYGIDTVLFPLGTLTSPLIQNNIQEWASPDFHSMPGQLLEGLIVLILVGLATGRVRARVTEWLWALSFLYLALASQRHVPLFVIAAAPLIARCTQAGLEGLNQIAGIFRPATPISRAALVATPFPKAGPPPRILLAINAAILLAVASGTIAYRALPNLGSAEEGRAIAAAFPVATTDALAALGRPLRVFNDYGYGGYLLFRLQPGGSRVFIDGRVEVYGPRVFEDYLAVSYVSTGWQSVLARYQPDAIVLPNAHPLVAVLQNDRAWRTLARDQVAAAFVRAGSER